MKTCYTVALSVLAGIGIGAVGVQTLRAQAKPPVYAVANNEVTDQDGYMKKYLPQAQQTIKEHGGVYIAAGKGTAIDGEPPKGRGGGLPSGRLGPPLAGPPSPQHHPAPNTPAP